MASAAVAADDKSARSQGSTEKHHRFHPVPKRDRAHYFGCLGEGVDHHEWKAGEGWGERGKVQRAQSTHRTTVIRSVTVYILLVQASVCLRGLVLVATFVGASMDNATTGPLIPPGRTFHTFRGVRAPAPGEASRVARAQRETARPTYI